LLTRARLVLTVALATPAMLVTGCSATVPGSAAPQAGGASAQPSPTSSPVAPSQAPLSPTDGCTVSVSGPGRLSMTGSGRASSTQGSISFACGTGPLVAITAIGDGGVSFSADGAETAVAKGSIAAVGPYQVSVIDAAGDAARFQVVPAH
jgi:hypothetical protein